MAGDTTDDGAGVDACAVARSEAIRRALRFMQCHLNDPISLPKVAAVAGLGVMQFSTTFRREVGMPPYRYLSHLRIARAKALLQEGMPLAMVAAEAGFFDQPHMYRHFRRVCGLTPGQYLARRATHAATSAASAAL